MKGFFQITENRLFIDGVNGEHTFLHISDTHICVSDALSTADEADKAAKQEKAWDDVKRGFAHHFGEPFNHEHDIPSTEAFCKLMEYAKTQQPEKLLLSGDVIDYISPAAIRFLTKKLNEYGSITFLYPVTTKEGSINILSLFPFHTATPCKYITATASLSQVSTTAKKLFRTSNSESLKSY